MQYKSFIDTLKTGGFQKDAFVKYKDSICEINQITLDYLLRYGSAAYALLALASIFVEQIAESFLVYVIVFVLLASLAFVSNICKRYTNKHVTPLIYLTVSVYLFSCLSITTQFHTKTEAVSYIASLAIFPPLILDRVSHIGIFTFLINLLFCWSVTTAKIPDVAVLDIVNSISFFVISLCLTKYMVNTKMARIISKAQLEWNDSLYKHILTSSNDIIFDFDILASNLSISQNGAEYFAVDRDNPISFIRFVFPEDRSKFKKILRGWKDNQHEEIRLKTLDGTYKWFNISTIAITDSNGNFHHIIGRITDINIQKTKEEALKRKSERDSLTGLYNKITTERIIQDYLDTSAYEECALILADIDNLKRINDTLGHIQGDRAIRAFAVTLQKCFNANATIGRIGGDEFMILLHTDHLQNNFDATLTQLTKSLANITVGEHNEYHISGSLGVALRTSNLEDFNDLYRNADSALYHVKNNGRNGFSFYQEFRKINA